MSRADRHYLNTVVANGAQGGLKHAAAADYSSFNHSNDAQCDGDVRLSGRH